jgi:hypothetical protein
MNKGVLKGFGSPSLSANVVIVGKDIISNVDVRLSPVEQGAYSVYCDNAISVFFPPVNPLMEGNDLYSITNRSSSVVSIRDKSGTLLFKCSAGTTTRFNLLDGTTDTGIWSKTESTANTRTIYASNTSGQSVASLTNDIAALDDVYALSVFQGASSFLYASLLTASNSPKSFSAGTVTQINSAAIDIVSISKLTDRSVMCVYNVVNTLYARVLTISNGVISVNTQYSVTTDAYNSGATIDVETISPTKALVTYRKNSAVDVMAVILDVSGTAISVGTPFAVASALSVATFHSLCVLDATRAIITWVQNSSSIKAQVLSISGSTITTPGAILTPSGWFANGVNLALIDTDKVVAVGATETGSYLQACILSVSSYTISAGTLSGSLSDSTAVSNCLVTAINKDTLLCTYAITGASLVACILSTPNGTTVRRAALPLTLTSLSTSAKTGLKKLNAGYCCFICSAQTSNYPVFGLLESNTAL